MGSEERIQRAESTDSSGGPSRW